MKYMSVSRPVSSRTTHCFPVKPIKGEERGFGLDSSGAETPRRLWLKG